MSSNYSNESMLEIFIYETSRLLEQLESLILESEKNKVFSKESINEIFRIMHTIKGSSAMMLADNVAELSHGIEDLFYFLRENNIEEVDFSALADIVFESGDFIKLEILKMKNGDKTDGDISSLTKNIHEFLTELKKANGIIDNKKGSKSSENSEVKPQKYYIAPIKSSDSTVMNMVKVIIFFEEGCEMENIRAFTVIHNLKDKAEEVIYFPEDIIENDSTCDIIKKHGFKIFLKSKSSLKEIEGYFRSTIFLKDMEFTPMNEDEYVNELQPKADEMGIDVVTESKVKFNDIADKSPGNNAGNHENQTQSIISVNVRKLDKLMDLVGELVISEAMVTQNTDIKGMELDNFNKAARQLRKITSELQDMVMSIRMVPIENTFHKMNRIVRDMCKKLNKDVQLEIIGENTEVDKNVIEHIADPLMHLIRNAIDHGIESQEERIQQGKKTTGTIVLQAENLGSDVQITVRDDGKGLNKDKILEKARNNRVISKPETELTDREIFSFIFLPGFSTQEKVTEFSGRGVGMDVVTKNIEAVGGTVTVDSNKGEGTVINIKIPLTLAIIEGMTVRVGNSRYTIPIISIRKSFKAKKSDIIVDPDNNEMIMERGKCYPVIRLHQMYKVKTEIKEIVDGIVIMVDDGEKAVCIFADELLGEQQVVVKSLPKYIRKVRGIAGCTLLGDGSISLILDISKFINNTIVEDVSK
jgi:two-component system chemotaxis sensor kinase CheA